MKALSRLRDSLITNTPSANDIFLCVCDAIQLSVFHYLSLERSLSGFLLNYMTMVMHFIDPKYKHNLSKIRLRNLLYCYLS